VYFTPPPPLLRARSLRVIRRAQERASDKAGLCPRDHGHTRAALLACLNHHDHGHRVAPSIPNEVTAAVIDHPVIDLIHRRSVVLALATAVPLCCALMATHEFPAARRTRDTGMR
jgi:hypothetical protein